MEALQIVNTCYARAKEVRLLTFYKIFCLSFCCFLKCGVSPRQILQQNRELMDAVVEQLVKKKSLTKQEFLSLVELHGNLKPMAPSILELRAAKRAQFEETMMMVKNQKESVAGNIS